MSANPCIDSQILATLRDVMGDDYALLIDTYLSDSATRIDSLTTALANHDADTVRRAAHSFKGSSSNIGAPRLAEYCGVMEALALAGDPAPWSKQLTLIKAEFAKVTALLKQ
jgi:HPt (histidine-containing phosphotransfer) domain-containing protein